MSNQTGVNEGMRDRDEAKLNLLLARLEATVEAFRGRDGSMESMKNMESMKKWNVMIREVSKVRVESGPKRDRTFVTIEVPDDLAIARGEVWTIHKA